MAVPAPRRRRAHRTAPDYTHLAFSVAEADYGALSARLIAECVIWKTDRSEGASTYFLDPDGHKLEIHLGTLETRLAHYREHPLKGVEVIPRETEGTSPVACRLIDYR